MKDYELEAIVETIMYLQAKIENNKAEIEQTRAIINKYTNYLEKQFPNEDINKIINETKKKILKRILGNKRM